MNKILTISVAAYNVENYIERCLDSFIECKNKELLEVIVTNDGSKDNTKKIVEKYQKKYPNVIKLIDKKNEGAGSTVNSGIKNATGKYFKMVDGDDWVDSKELDKLLNKLSKVDVDMVITDYVTFSDYYNKTVSITKYNIETNKIMNIDNILNNNKFQMHNILYRTSIMKDNNIKLDNGFYTDMEYLLFPLRYVKKTIYYNFNVYYYRIGREGQSVSLSSMQKHIDMHRIVLENLIKNYTLLDDNVSVDVRNYILKKIVDVADTELMTMLTFKNSKDNIQKIKEFFEYIKNYDEIYSLFKNGKKEKILLITNFRFISILSVLVKRKYNN